MMHRMPIALAILVLPASCIEEQVPREDHETREETHVVADADLEIEVEVDEVIPDADGVLEDTTTPSETISDTSHTDAADSGDTNEDDTLSTPETVAPSCDPACRNGGTCTAAGTCSCVDGWVGPTCEVLACGGSACPALPGYTPGCNTTAHCEYARTAPTQPWHADDVWIYVPPGSFLMGSPEDELDSMDTEHPIREVTFTRGFFVAKLEVTVRLYEACVAGGSCSSAGVDLDWSGSWGLSGSANGRAQHPQNGLTWPQAEEVCAFVGGRRPTSAEWEYAANGRGAHRRYPWGDEPDPVCGIHAVFADDSTAHSGHGCGLGGTWVVGPAQRTAGRSAVGAHDMAGNLLEWVEDCMHARYEGAPNDGGAWTAGDCGARATRGGTFSFLPAATRNAFLWFAPLGERNALIGARCVKP